MLFSLVGTVSTKAPHQLVLLYGPQNAEQHQAQGWQVLSNLNLHPSPGICRAGAAPAKKLRSGTPSCAGPFREKNPLLPALVILLQIFPDVMRNLSS